MQDEIARLTSKIKRLENENLQLKQNRGGGGSIGGMEMGLTLLNDNNTIGNEKLNKICLFTEENHRGMRYLRDWTNNEFAEIMYESHAKAIRDAMQDFYESNQTIFSNLTNHGSSFSPNVCFHISILGRLNLV